MYIHIRMLAIFFFLQFPADEEAHIRMLTMYILQFPADEEAPATPPPLPPASKLPSPPYWLPLYHNGPNMHLVCCDVEAPYFGALIHVVVSDSVCQVNFYCLEMLESLRFRHTVLVYDYISGLSLQFRNAVFVYDGQVNH